MRHPITIRFIFKYRDVLLPGLKIYVKRRVFWFLMLMSALCIILSFFLKEDDMQLRTIGIVCMLAPLSMFIIMVILQNRKLHNKEVVYTFSEHNIVYLLNNEEQEQDWSTIARLVSTNDHIMLFCSTRRAHIIPKRAFASAGELKKLTDLIAAKRPDLLTRG